MRWILVFIFFYLIPLIVLFKNYKNVPKSLKNMLKKAEEPKLDYSDFEKRLFNIRK